MEANQEYELTLEATSRETLPAHAKYLCGILNGQIYLKPSPKHKYLRALMRKLNLST